MQKRVKASNYKSLGEILGVPAVLSVISLAGLVAALLVRGWPDIAFALAAGAGLFATGWVILRKR